jgi:hypothetical protein
VNCCPASLGKGVADEQMSQDFLHP